MSDDDEVVMYRDDGDDGEPPWLPEVGQVGYIVLSDGTVADVLVMHRGPRDEETGSESISLTIGEVHEAT